MAVAHITGAALSLFRIARDGGLHFARAYDIDVGQRTMWWMGMVEQAMKFGASMFFTDYSMTPAELARRAGGARLRHRLGAGALAHPAVAQDAVPGRRRSAEAVLRRDGPVRDADRGGGGDQDAEGRHRRLPGRTSAIRSRPRSWSPRSTRSPAAASCSASATAGTRTRWRTTAPSSRRATSWCASGSRR